VVLCVAKGAVLSISEPNASLVSFRTRETASSVEHQRQIGRASKNGLRISLLTRSAWSPRLLSHPVFALKRVLGVRELHGLLVQCRPSPSGEKGGRPKKETVRVPHSFPKRHATNTRAYIEQRLKREGF
jgi:hypothetical protein